MQIKEAIDKYFKYLRVEKGVSNDTILSYHYDLNEFFKVLKNCFTSFCAFCCILFFETKLFFAMLQLLLWNQNFRLFIFISSSITGFSLLYLSSTYCSIVKSGLSNCCINYSSYFLAAWTFRWATTIMRDWGNISNVSDLVTLCI